MITEQADGGQRPMNLGANIKLYEDEILKRPMTEREKLFFTAGYTFALIDSADGVEDEEQ